MEFKKLAVIALADLPYSQFEIFIELVNLIAISSFGEGWICAFGLFHMMQHMGYNHFIQGTNHSVLQLLIRDDKGKGLFWQKGQYFYEIGKILQLLAILIPICSVFSLRQFLLLLLQDSGVADNAFWFGIYFLPGLIFYSQYDLLRRFTYVITRSKEKINYLQIFLIVYHSIAAGLTAYHFGAYGIPICTSLTYFLALFGLSQYSRVDEGVDLYTLGIDSLKQSNAKEEYKTFLIDIGKEILYRYLSYPIAEFSLLIAGYIGLTCQTTQVVLLYVVFSLKILTFPIITACQFHLRSLVTQQKVEEIKVFLWQAVLIFFCISLYYACICWVPSFIELFFTDYLGVFQNNELFVSVLTDFPLLSMFIIPHQIYTFLRGICETLDKKFTLGFGNTGASLSIFFPIAIVYGVVFGYGTQALFIALTINDTILCLGYGIYLLITMAWTQYCKEQREQEQLLYENKVQWRVGSSRYYAENNEI